MVRKTQFLMVQHNKPKLVSEKSVKGHHVGQEGGHTAERAVSEDEGRRWELNGLDRW